MVIIRVNQDVILSEKGFYIGIKVIQFIMACRTCYDVKFPFVAAFPKYQCVTHDKYFDLLHFVLPLSTNNTIIPLVDRRGIDLVI